MPPSSSTSSSEARPWVAALLVGLALELALAAVGPTAAPIDAGLRFFGAATEPTESETIIDHQLRRLDAIEVPAQVVVLGDSSALTAVIPKVLSDALGVPVENLGTIAPLHVEGHLAVLDRYLSRVAAPPRLVIYHFSDASLSAPLAEIERIGSRAALDDWLGRAPLQQGWLPSYHLRPLARRLIGGDRYPAWPNDAGQGAFMRRTHGYLRETHEGYDWAGWRRVQVPIHADAMPGLEGLIARTVGRGIPLLLVRAPVPEAAADAQARAHHAANGALLGQIAAAVPGVRVAEPYLRVLPTSAFGTPNHPLLPAAQANSRWLADQARPLLVAPGVPSPAAAP